MKPSPHATKNAFTLLELSVVIMVLLALMGMGLYVSGRMRDWKLGRLASESLREVYSAQRLYLADNPTAAVESLTPELLIPYLPNRAAAMPTVKSLEGTQLNIIVNQSPPVVNNGSDQAYDPSGSETDSLWDVGE